MAPAFMSAGYLEKVSMKKKGKENENEEKLETVYIEDESGLGSGPPQPQTGEGAPPVGVIAVEIKEAGALEVQPLQEQPAGGAGSIHS